MSPLTSGMIYRLEFYLLLLSFSLQTSSANMTWRHYRDAYNDR